jgi:hypothetical protein
MSHDVFNASATATWIECSWSALNAVPDAPKKRDTVEAAERGTARHDDMEAGEVPDVEAFIQQLENPPSTVREFRVRLTDNCGGTVDIFSHGWRNAENIATIIDGKFGKWDVPAKHNKQLLTYSASLLAHSSADWWRLVIYQPNGLDEDPWKQWVASRAEVEEHKRRVLIAINDRGPPKPGPHCRWCNAFQACPAMTTDAGFVMGAMVRPIESLTTQELVRLLRLIRALGDAKTAYEEALETHFKLGRVADGAGLKPQRAYRAFNDEQQAAEYGYQHYGAKGVRPLTPAQLEKLGTAGKAYTSVASHRPEGKQKAWY